MWEVEYPDSSEIGIFIQPLSNILLIMLHDDDDDVNEALNYAANVYSTSHSCILSTSPLYASTVH